MLFDSLQPHDFYEFEHKTRGVEGHIGMADVSIHEVTSPTRGWIVRINETVILLEEDTGETAIFPNIAEAKAQAAWYVLANALITAQGAQRLMDDLAKERMK